MHVPLIPFSILHRRCSGSFLNAPAFGGFSVKTIIQLACPLGVTFHGTKINDSIARALQSVAPFVQDSRVQIALKTFENLSPALNDHTKLSMLMNVAARYYGKGTEAAFINCSQFLVLLHSSLLYKDIVKDSHVTKDFLVGSRGKAGFSHVSASAAHSLNFCKL